MLIKKTYIRARILHFVKYTLQSRHLTYIKNISLNDNLNYYNKKDRNKITLIQLFNIFQQL